MEVGQKLKDESVPVRVKQRISEKAKKEVQASVSLVLPEDHGLNFTIVHIFSRFLQPKC